VTKEDELAWEARFARPAAAAAFLAGVLLLAGTFVLQSVFDDRPRVEALPDSLLSIDEAPGTLIASAVLQALSALFLIGVFFYLFRATIRRSPQIPSWFVYLIFIGPIFYAIAQVLGAFDRVDLAEQFADGTANTGACPAVNGQAGDDCANDLIQDNVDAVAFALGLAGSVATAFLFVMLPMRARRVGLMSQFMAILGVVAGLLMILPLVQLLPQILQAFWLGAVGALFLGAWPGGRGPAWETGEADSWPTAAERRGVAAGGAASGPPAEPPAKPEPVPERPSSRKRRRKKR
jgi:hypothetical protein